MTVSGTIVSSGTPGNVLTENAAGLAPTFQALGSGLASFYPGLAVLGFQNTVGTSIQVITVAMGQSFFVAYKNCTVYMMSGNATGTAAQNITFQPYGTVNGITAAGPLGTSKVVASSAYGSNSTSFSQAQSISLVPGGYIGITGQATTSQQFALNVILWISQTGM
jgi:hypothetical protein